MGIIPKNIVDALTDRQIFKDEINCDPRTGDDRLSCHDIGIANNSWFCHKRYYAKLSMSVPFQGQLLSPLHPPLHRPLKSVDHPDELLGRHQELGMLVAANQTEHRADSDAEARGA